MYLQLILDPSRHFRVDKVDMKAEVDRLEKVDTVDIEVSVDMVYKVDRDPAGPN